MSLKLDWDIESEQGKHQEHQEDFKQRSRRYLGFFRLLLIVSLFTAILGLIVFGVLRRWEQVNARVDQLLRDTVQAEVAALRIGDFDSYINIQRSATDDWYVMQEQSFNEYQQLKINADVTLTGKIITSAVDGQRGRIQVEEIINSVPFVRTWFYWRYEDGWRHVPSDYTFWGEFATIENPRFAIRYHTVDDPVAQELAIDVTRWLDDACTIIECNDLPLLTFDIVTDKLPEVYWAPNEQSAWQMVLPSPYLGQARADQAFGKALQVDTATLLANRLVDRALDNEQAIYPSDAYFLRSTIVAWIVGRFVEVNPEAYLIESIAMNYGREYIALVLQNLQPISDIGILSSVLNEPSLVQANLDWRDFVDWRIRTELELIQHSDEANWQRLYDFSDETVRQAAYARYGANSTSSLRRVVDVSHIADLDGTTQLQARIELDVAGQIIEEIVYFRLVNNIWLRSS